MIYIQPSTSFEATLSGAPTGLVGTVGIQILDGQGNVSLARSTTSIVESPAGSGVYTATKTSPSTAGQYVVVWDTGTVSPSTTATEDLMVTSSATAPWAVGEPLEPFVSREDLGDYLGQILAGDDKALIAVDAACSICRTIAEQTFNAVAGDTITLDGTGTDALLLPERPVVNVESVTEGTTDLVVDEDYRVNGNGVLMRMPGLIEAPYQTQVQTLTYWTPGRQNISVTYSHGYPLEDVPRDVRMVALTMAARLFQQTTNIRSETLGAHTISYASESGVLTDTERLVLTKYRQVHT